VATYIVVSASPPARRIHELLALLRRNPRDLVVVSTPAATGWIDESKIQNFTAWPIRTRQRMADEPKVHPSPALVIAAPMTFNTINKWAAGINDNVALGVLNEALGARAPIVAAPVTGPVLAAHPAFARSVQILTDAGVDFTATDAIAGPDGWQSILARI
jgi:phosphopantothenoylcysteine synthetase/decarboxylase